ncbi:efflux RND transporter periplasmic adaptor subunit [Marinomonas ostreistagni]|uniref:Efflux RND transporter periplasmic adaptor subunit n=1 Tax=Marinomonas ostreistagni TaxID=359209 RepID=A0ABS0ZGU2_9GAMM|nr:efflux RND transporter periplasmic adaptor subunit [Marinomonas ostreistagni]MBJ7552216.1 efflux RND transporter periplasmic adaptor subunit [Marinomonas ostreistagni]
MQIKNKLGPALAVVIVATTIVWMLSGSNGITHAQSESNTQDSSSPESDHADQAFFVKATTSQAVPVTESITLSGQTTADNIITLTNRIAGYVTDVFVTKGQSIEAGKVLFKIDDRSLKASHLYAKALVKQRTLELQGVLRLNNQQLTSQVSVAEAEAALASAKANLIDLELDIEKTSMTSHSSGVLNKFAIEKNQWLDIGSDVAQIVDVSPLKVTTLIPQKYIGKTLVGSPVNLKGPNNIEITGIITFIDTIADEATRSLPVEITLDDAKGLPAGISVDINLPLKESNAHPISPALLSINDDGDMSVKTLEGNTVVSRAVSVIKSDRNHAWVSGLPNTVTIITSGQGFVKDGDFVKAEVTDGVQAQ